jgi:hypothetical protein
VGAFLPLSTQYSKLVSALLHKSDGICGMSKRLFYGLFKEAWSLALTKQNILSAWAKTGIAPFDPSIVLNALKVRPLALPESEDETTAFKAVKTPRTAKSFRYFKQEFYRNPFKLMIRKLFKLAE